MAPTEGKEDSVSTSQNDRIAKAIVILCLVVVSACIGSLAYFLFDSIINKADPNEVTEGNCTCGKINEALPTSDTHPNQFPWQVGFLQTISQRIMCGGVLLSDRFVLTTARCMKTALFQSDSEREYFFKIVLGEHDVSNKGPTQWFWAIGIVVFPEYDETTGENDLAIVKLSSRAKFNSYVRNICLPYKRSREVPETAITAGWATLKSEKAETLELQHEELRILKDCEDVISGNYSKKNKICARSRIRDCRGDFGGPLFAKISDEPFYTLLGVTFKAETCEYLAFSAITDSFLRWTRGVLLGTAICPKI